MNTNDYQMMIEIVATQIAAGSTERRIRVPEARLGALQLVCKELGWESEDLRADVCCTDDGIQIRVSGKGIQGTIVLTVTAAAEQPIMDLQRFATEPSIEDDGMYLEDLGVDDSGFTIDLDKEVNIPDDFHLDIPGPAVYIDIPRHRHSSLETAKESMRAMRLRRMGQEQHLAEDTHTDDELDAIIQAAG